MRYLSDVTVGEVFIVPADDPFFEMGPWLLLEETGESEMMLKALYLPSSIIQSLYNNTRVGDFSGKLSIEWKQNSE